MLATLRVGLLAMALTFLALGGARATPATYIFVGDIVGTLDGTDVRGELTLTVTGDTDDIFISSPAQLLSSSIVSTFDLAGFGSFTVSNDSYVFARPDVGFVGFGVQGLASCCDIIQILDPAFIGYDLNDAIGPVLGAPNPSLADWVGVPTSAGLFTVTSMTNNTFQAVIGGTPVPEPGLPGLLLLAAAGAWVASRRRLGARPLAAHPNG